jgi:superoxide dismutase
MTKKKLLLSILIVAVVMGVTGIYGAFSAYKTKQETAFVEFLSSLGYESVTIGAQEIDLDAQKLVLQDIALDEHGFETINQITASVPPFWGDANEQTLIISGMKTIQSYDIWLIEGFPKVFELISRLQAYKKITVEDMQIDLNTALGALRFITNGHITHKNDISMISARVVADQNQLAFDSKIAASFAKTNQFNIEAEFEDAALRLDDIKANRVTGWLGLSRTPSDIMPVITGQIIMGRLQIADLSLHDVDVTLEGSFASPKTIIKAKVSNKSNMNVHLETEDINPNNAAAQRVISARIETDNLDDLISFLQDLHSAGTKQNNLVSVSSLLLTQGNLERIAAEIKELDFARLVLEISGTKDDLAGKVTSYVPDGAVERKFVTSLEPLFGSARAP